jgi:hypothetical protein
MQLLKTTGSPSLDVLFAKIAENDELTLKKLDGLVITDTQLDLMEIYGEDVKFVRCLPTNSLTECPECKAVAIVAGVAPSKCTLTLGCLGKPVKSGMGRKAIIKDGEDRASVPTPEPVPA